MNARGKRTTRGRRGFALTAIVILAAGCASQPDYRTLIDPKPVSINARDPAILTSADQVLFQNITAFPVTLNPLRIDAPPEARLIAAAMYPRAFIVKPDGSVALDSNYFESAEQIQDDPQTLRLRINPAAVWSDGNPVTWRDVACQFELFQGHTSVKSAVPGPGFDRIQSVVRGADDHEAIVTFRSNQNYYEWQGMFAPPYALLPCSVTSDAGNFDAPPSVEALSAGPFVISAVRPESGSLDLRPNPRWWGAAPHVGMIALTIPDTDTAASTIQGATRLLSDDELLPLEDLAGYSDVRSSTQRGWISLVFNTTESSRMADEHLRRAIATSIDREELSINAFRALTPLPEAQDSNIFVGDRGLDDPSLLTSYDPVNAGEALDALGWKLDGDTRKKDGQPLTLRIGTQNVNDDLQRALRSQLASVGIGLENIDIATGAADPEAVDAAIAETTADAFPLRGAYSLRITPDLSALGCCGVAVSDLIEQAAVADTGDEVNERLTEIDRLLWQQARIIPLIQIPDVVATDSQLANYGAFGIADIDATAIGFVH